MSDTAIPEIPIVYLTQEGPLSRVSLSYREVQEPLARIPNGSLVRIFSKRGHELGKGFYNRHARVRVRVLTTSPAQVVDDTFFSERLQSAIEWRLLLQLPERTNAFRLVHAEGDDLPGLVVDKFNDLIVIEFYSSGMFKKRRLIKSVFQAQFPGCGFYTFSKRQVQKQESYDHYEDPIPSPVLIEENGLKFQVHPGTGHKTGFFLDQRENRNKIAAFTPGKTLLDLCCHAGGFSLYGRVKGQAKAVVGVDRDPIAIAQAERNAALNETTAKFVTADLNEFFVETPPAPENSFDVVVLDPPKQTKSVEGIHGAIRRYIDWNRHAVERVKPGGLLVSCSCSGLVRDSDFRNLLWEVERRSGRRLNIIGWSSAAPDHPFSFRAPETHYLKVAWIKVD